MTAEGSVMYHYHKPIPWTISTLSLRPKQPMPWTNMPWTNMPQTKWPMPQPYAPCLGAMHALEQWPEIPTVHFSPKGTSLLLEIELGVINATCFWNSVVKVIFYLVVYLVHRSSYIDTILHSFVSILI